uniref:Uncharacterized protein n=1 Tax=Clastoptera arizonana TaxID=38151 RepID=A0A1B6DVU0_9HEMI
MTVFLVIYFFIIPSFVWSYESIFERTEGEMEERKKNIMEYLDEIFNEAAMFCGYYYQRLHEGKLPADVIFDNYKPEYELIIRNLKKICEIMETNVNKYNDYDYEVVVDALKSFTTLKEVEKVPQKEGKKMIMKIIEKFNDLRLCPHTGLTTTKTKKKTT